VVWFLKITSFASSFGFGSQTRFWSNSGYPSLELTLTSGWPWFKTFFPKQNYLKIPVMVPVPELDPKSDPIPIQSLLP
jgi:hypothetical protein